MSITVSEARTALGYKLKDISDVDSSTFLKWCNYLNRRIWRKLQNIDPEQFISTSTITTAVDTASYALPSDFNNIRPLGCGLYLIDGNSDTVPTMLAKTRPNSYKTGFYINSTNVVFTPVPKKVQSYTLRYISDLADLDSNDDTFVIPDEFEEVVLFGLEAQYAAWDEDANLEVLADERFIRAMQEMVENYTVTSNSFYLPDFSNSY